jgi:hypothetical protein
MVISALAASGLLMCQVPRCTGSLLLQTIQREVITMPLVYMSAAPTWRGIAGDPVIRNSFELDALLATDLLLAARAARQWRSGQSYCPVLPLHQETSFPVHE